MGRGDGKGIAPGALSTFNFSSKSTSTIGRITMNVRRVVTGHAGGKSKIVSEGGTRRSRSFKNIPGQSAALVWSTPAVPALPLDGTDVISENSTYLPLQPGETRLMIVTFAPDSVMMSIDPVAGFQEFAEHVPDLAAAMEPDSPGMHTTSDGRLRHRPRRGSLARSRRRQAGPPQAARRCRTKRHPARVAQQKRQAGQDRIRSHRSAKDLKRIERDDRNLDLCPRDGVLWNEGSYYDR